MRRLLMLGLVLGSLVLILPGRAASAETPLNALIVTSQGVYHNYRQQTWILAHRIAEHANVRFDVSLAEPERWRTTDYSDGYDVLIYNMCTADNTDAALIGNMRRQTEELGVPALVIHCTMHSFRDTDLWWPMLGLKTTEHEPLRALSPVKSEPHAILSSIPDEWTLTHDELYINLAFEGRPLLTVTGEDGKEHVTAWLSYPGGTPVFGTTLGHSEATIKNPPYQRMLANALLYVTGNLTEHGEPRPGMEGNSDAMSSIESHLKTLRGRKFYGLAYESEGGMDYYAGLVPDNEIEERKFTELGFPIMEIEGGTCARIKLFDWPSKIDQIGPTFGAMISEYGIDPSRPQMEFYRSHNELHLLLPVP